MRISTYSEEMKNRFSNLKSAIGRTGVFNRVLGIAADRFSKNANV
jgi:hypothetical protein